MTIYKYIFSDTKKDVLDINYIQHTFSNIYPIYGYQLLWDYIYYIYIILYGHILYN